MLLGYPPATKGYKLLNLSSKKVFISKDVVFHEHIFSFISRNPGPLSSSPIVFPHPTPDLTTTLTLPSSHSLVYHDSFFHDQHFAPDVDFDFDDDLSLFQFKMLPILIKFLLPDMI